MATLQDLNECVEYSELLKIKVITTLLLSMAQKEIDKMVYVKFSPEIELFIKSTSPCIHICEDWGYYIMNEQIIRMPQIKK